MSRAGFLDRWSARKREQAARAAEPAPPPAPVEDAPVEGAQAEEAAPSLSEEAAAQMTDAQALAALRLPDPASLPHGADFTAFLRAGVPKRLQRMALRRLWTVTPAQAALDGLVDYAEDYTDAAVAVETLATTYEAGRGLRAHTEALARAEEKAAQDEARRERSAQDGADDGDDAPTADDADAPETDVARAETADAPAVAASPPPRIADAAAPAPHAGDVAQDGQTRRPALKTPRRMAFRFDDA